MDAKTELGYVYFVLCQTTNLIKIGYSASHPDKRLMDFRLGCSVHLDRFGYVRENAEHEKELHRRYFRLRDHGEWFRSATDLLGYIRKYAETWTIEVKSCEADRKFMRERMLREHVSDYGIQTENFKDLMRAQVHRLWEAERPKPAPPVERAPQVKRGPKPKAAVIVPRHLGSFSLEAFRQAAGLKPRPRNF